MSRVILYSIGSIEERWIIGLCSFGCLFFYLLWSFGLHQSKQLAAKRRAAWRRLKAKRCLHFALFLSVAVTYATLMVSQSIWSKERSFTWWDRIVHGSFTEEDWLENFWMCKGTFLYLCQELYTTHHFIAWHTDRKALPCEMWVAITLWWLRTNDSYRTVRQLFSVSHSSVSYREGSVSSYSLPMPIATANVSSTTAIRQALCDYVNQ